MTELKTLKDLECNVLTNRIDLDKQEEKAICPKCRDIVSKGFIGTECLKCSVHINEGDPLSGWKERIDFIGIKLPKESLGFEKGYLKSELRQEAIKWIKEIDYQQQKKLTGDNIIYSEEVLEGMRNWIKMFFNLFEEEKNDIKNFERF